MLILSIILLTALTLFSMKLVLKFFFCSARIVGRLVTLPIRIFFAVLSILFLLMLAGFILFMAIL